MTDLPPLFLERLHTIIPLEYLPQVQKSFSLPAPVTVRINTLKTSIDKILQTLTDRGMAFTRIPWMDEALILSPGEIDLQDLIEEGLLYRQGLSSMLPPLILNPQSGESVLDMCAAPGSKTTQMAARMQNQGHLLAIESVRQRYYKLKSVVTHMGASMVSLKLMDARRLRPPDPLFDKILLDVPCSTEGRFQTNDPKSYAFWSLRKIKEMAHKQRGLLLSASRLLKPNGMLLYSTCTFAPEENEGIIDWFLRKTSIPFEVEPTDFPDIKSYPALLEWQEKSFDPRVKNCLRVLPDGNMEGFFVAKLRRLS